MTRITLLDGSVGQEVVKLSGCEPTPILWSTAIMMNMEDDNNDIDGPRLLRQVHDSYFTAGATIATTNTYAILPDRLQKAGVPLDQLQPLTMMAINAAVTSASATERRDVSGSSTSERGQRRRRVAGSIGPLGLSYRPDQCPSPEKAVELYKESIVLMAPHVDLFLIETMSSIRQAEGALRACTSAETMDGKKPIVWLAVTVMDDDGARLRSGEPLTALAALVKTYEPHAVLINCSRPEAISKGLEILSTFNVPFGAYANGFTCITDEFKQQATVSALQARTDLSPTRYADYCMEWIDQGATIVGGCCEVGPAHIAELASRILKAGHEIA